tara:strand:- start:185 stop:904 length:720 start_codon:yes stop_codon:yes gene_type:complete
MINKKYLKNLRARRVLKHNNFIYETISKRIVDSIDLLNVEFQNILELGINENNIYNYLSKKFPYSNIKRSDFMIKIDKEFFNLIYSNLFIHLSSDFEKLLNTIKNILKPNGFFIATIPDLNNIYQLVNSMYEADLHFYSGTYQRINPTINIDDTLSILKKLNFDTPSINTDSFLVEYNDFKSLLNDIRSMNLSYCMYDKKTKFENKKYFLFLEEIYRNKYYNNCYPLEIKFNIISAWKK